MDLHPLLLGVFGIVIVLMMLLDLGVFHKKDHVVSTREAATWTIVWVSLSMAFSLLVWFNMGQEYFYQYQSAYWIEESLSVDNLFVFILVFKQLQIPKEYQHRVLFYGIIGAIIFRALFIFAGIGLVNATYLDPITFMGKENVQFNIVLTVFGIILLVAGLKTLKSHSEEAEKKYNKSLAARLTRKYFRVLNTYDGHNFFFVRNGVRFATPLFTALIIIEISDLIFALDSIPAIFSVSKDPIILYTSNIFAILGLRSLYFLLSGIIDKFRFLHYGLAAILIFIGIKMIVEPIYEIHSLESLIVILIFLTISILASVFIPSKQERTNI